MVEMNQNNYDPNTNRKAIEADLKQFKPALWIGGTVLGLMLLGLVVFYWNNRDDLSTNYRDDITNEQTTTESEDINTNTTPGE